MSSMRVVRVLCWCQRGVTVVSFDDGARAKGVVDPVRRRQYARWELHCGPADMTLNNLSVPKVPATDWRLRRAWTT